MADFSALAFLQEPLFMYPMVFLIAIGIGWIMYRKIKSERPPDKFRGQSLQEVLETENIAPLVKTFGRKTRNGKLISELNVIPIKRIAMAKFKSRKINDKDKDPSESEFYVFQSGTNRRIMDLPLLRRLSKRSDYYVINRNEEYLIKDTVKDTWKIKPDIFLYQLGGIWVCSHESRKFITELVYKKIFENIKEEDMNYPKRIVWYNDKYASQMTSREQEYELEDRKWSRRAERETKD